MPVAYVDMTPPDAHQRDIWILIKGLLKPIGGDKKHTKLILISRVLNPIGGDRKQNLNN